MGLDMPRIASRSAYQRENTPSVPARQKSLEKGVRGVGHGGGACASKRDCWLKKNDYYSETHPAGTTWLPLNSSMR